MNHDFLRIGKVAIIPSLTDRYIIYIYRSFRNLQEGLAGLYLNRSNVSAMYSPLSEKWNNLKQQEFTARFVPFFDLWMLLPTPRKKQEKTCIYYIRRTKLHKTNHIYHKTANKKYRHLSTGKLAKILDSRVKVYNLSWNLRPKNDSILQRLSKAQLYSSVSGNGLYRAILLNMNLPLIAEEGGQFKGLVTTWVSGICGVG